jgi:hypothetical protein
MNNMERVMVAVAGLAMVFAIALMFVTSGRYMDLQSLHVHDSKAGQPVAIAYDREFRRDFYGQWNVFVWEVARGVPQSYCETGGAWPYKTGKPDRQKTLEWLVDGDQRCSKLPPGLYQVEVKIKANPGGILERTARVTSNVFEVSP